MIICVSLAPATVTAPLHLNLARNKMQGKCLIDFFVGAFTLILLLKLIDLL